MADAASLIVRVTSTGVDQAAKGLDGLAKSATTAEKAESSLEKQSSRTSEVTGRLGTVAQSAGRQIQDLTVQIQGGQSALLAIGQQAPQFLDAFGPIGAVTGAVIALGAAFAGPLMRAMGDATVSAEELKEANKQLASVLEETDYGVVGLSESLIKLAQSNEVAARSQISLALVNTKVAADAASQAISESADSFADVSVQLVNLDKVTRQFGASSAEAFDQNLALTSQVENLSEEYGITSDQVLDLVRAQDAFNKQPTVENAQALATSMISVTDSSSGANSEFIRLTAEVAKNAQIMIKAAGDAEALKQAQQNLKASMEELSAATASQNNELIESLRIQTLAGKEQILAKAEQNKRLIEQDKSLSAEQITQAKAHYDTMAQMQIDAINAREAKTTAANNKSSKSDADKRAAEEERADKYLAKLEQDNMTELELISVHEEQKKAVLDEYRKQGLVDKFEYEAAITEIEKTAAQERADLELEAMNQINEANQKLFDAEMEIQKANAEAKAKQMEDGKDALDNMTGDLKAALGENNDLYKAAAITKATIDTYTAANAAYAAMAGIPVVGPALGVAAAAAAIAAGAANVAAIAGAREQGGYMSAGSAYQMAERGKAEVIVPAGNSRAKTIGQMNEMMGGNAGGPSNIVIVNQTSGRIDSVQQERTEDEIRLIVREEMVSQTVDQGSSYAKARRSTRGQPGY